MPTSAADPPVEHQPSLARPSLAADPFVIGTISGLIAAVGYTATNAFLREVADEDPAWVSCLRALPTVLLFGPWLVWKASQGQRIFPAWRVIGAIVMGGCAAQFLGNTLFQWSLRVVGMALAIPLCLGTLIIGGAACGWWLLKEPVSRRTGLALALLVSAVCVLSLAADDAHRQVARSLNEAPLDTHSPWYVTLGVLAACGSGVCFAALGISIRYSVKSACPPTTLMFIVGLIGTLGLGAVSLSQHGASELLATDPAALRAMLAAGVCNAVSFLFMTKALELTNVAYAYALNATQATLGAITGVLLFDEAATPWLGVGVALTIAGLLWMNRKS